VDPLTIVMLAVLALLIFFMFRNSRKRQRDVAAMADRTKAGAQVMTNFGVFGTILSIDDEENQVLLETTPGTVLKVHRQTIAKIITPSDVVAEDEDEDVVIADPAVEPDFGERLPVQDDTQKPSAGSVKKTDQ
jgi:preprotein translocase subunit YajC